jgi:hypothetical protein
MTMNANLQTKCFNGDPRESFLVSLGKEKQIVPWTSEMQSNWNSNTSTSTELAHQEMAFAFGFPHTALFTMTYINEAGKETVFPLCVVRSLSWWQCNSQLTCLSPPSSLQAFVSSRTACQQHILGEVKICAVRGKEWNFTVSCAREQKIIPWTEDLANGYATGAWVDIAHQLIANAFGVPQGVRMMLTYINCNGDETQLCDNMTSFSLYSY